MAYRWDGDQLVGQQQYLADGTAARDVQWVYEPGSFRPLAQVEGKGDVTRLHYIITDLAGTARELCSEEGEVHWRGEQGLWGAHREERRPIPLRRYLGDAANEEVYCELRYQGQLYDAETGLYYNRHRYYDAESGQYISPDPIGLLGGLRPQGYVHNPLEWVDPFGLSGLDITGRPLSSPNYSVWYQTEIPADLRNGSRPVHFQNANQQLYNSIQQNPGLSTKLPPEVVNHVQPGPKGAFARTSPPNHTWHHNAQSPEKIELVPRGQHQAPGNVQSTLHPNQEGGFKKLGSGKKCG